jgi:hypothetical protein
VMFLLLGGRGAGIELVLGPRHRVESQNALIRTLVRLGGHSKGLSGLWKNQGCPGHTYAP